MENQNRGKQFTLIASAGSRDYFRKIIFLTSYILVLVMVGQAQWFPQNQPDSRRPVISPSLENQVRSLLRESSRRLELIRNNGQQGLPEKVIAYFSSKRETVFIEKECLRVVVTTSLPIKTEAGEKSPENPASLYYHSSSFMIRFSGALPVSEIISRDAFGCMRNYFTRHPNGFRQIQAGSFSEITLQNIYPGTDLRLYSQQDGHLEFDWILWPGAEMKNIRMQFTGQKKLHLQKDGSLQLQLSQGQFTMHLPESYQVTPAGKLHADIQFRLFPGNQVSFRALNGYNRQLPLVIDPDLLWGTFFDGDNTNFDEYLYGIEYSIYNSRIYCSGAASLQVSVLYAAALSHAYDSTFQSTPDVLVYALTKDGQFITDITYLGGSGADVGVGISVTPTMIYVSGYTSSADFPVTLASAGNFASFDSVYHGNTDGFVATFNPTLDSLWYCSYLGGDGTDKALTIRATQDSSYYVSLSTTDTLPVASPNYIINEADNIFDGNSEAWIGRFTGFSNLSFGTYIGGNSDDLINDFQVLSNGDIVFSGNTRNITEVNASMPNGAGRDALFGRITVPTSPSGSASFAILDRFGGGGSDFGWGILSLGDTVSILVGQTNSTDFPLGAGTPFQATNAGQIDGFIARVNNDGSSGYMATYTGGSDDDILVSVRPVAVNNQIALLSWGTTASNDLQVRNLGSGTFYSSSNTGGYDMLFVITSFNFFTKYYLSYIGGSMNDYLGATGAPVGSNHLYYNVGDSALYLGTTTHSYETTQVPVFVGRGPADYENFGVPVFDEVKNNSSNDTHVIIALSMRGLYGVLSTNQVLLEVQKQTDCRTNISWEMAGNATCSSFEVERSTDGVHYTVIATLPATAGAIYQYTDNPPPAAQCFYRVLARQVNGSFLWSPIRSVRTCNTPINALKIFPTLINREFSIAGLQPFAGRKMQIDVTDITGARLFSIQKLVTQDYERIQLPLIHFRGAGIIQVRDIQHRQLIHSQKILLGN